MVRPCSLVPPVGTTAADLFPAWALSQRQALDQAGISPPAIELTDTDLTATRWADQQDVEWILLIPSLAAAHTTSVIRPVDPGQLVPFTLQWNPNRAHTMAVARLSTPHSPPSRHRAGAPSLTTCTTASDLADGLGSAAPTGTLWSCTDAPGRRRLPSRCAVTR